ncbi:MAG TPA: membrane-bound lytic murein transglycosylase MltF [Gammaproteobacteria bacterium]|nr:membrane-bound lytic murein transglycosylase MltF [Gammaproteobacteria bacterium]
MYVDLTVLRKPGVRSVRAVAGISMALMLTTCSQVPNVLSQVKQLGRLRVVMRYSPTVYYRGAHGPAGFEYDLARRFADYLGVKLDVIIPNRFRKGLPLLADGRAQMIAAGLTVGPAWQGKLRFGPVFGHTTPQLVYHSGEAPPPSLSKLGKGSVKVIAGTSQASLLRRLQKAHPKLRWNQSEVLGIDGLLHAVSKGKVAYTVANSNEVLLARRYYPGIRVAFDLGDKRGLAWGFRESSDGSLRQAASRFFRKVRSSGELARLHARYFAHAQELNPVGARMFAQDTLTRLPKYLPQFREAAADTGIDWRLLAAMGYQESHWNPHAISYTGVRGLMMLTRGTADDVGVDNRRDADQSIDGGARYLKQIEERLPSGIPEPDRTWMALAAYNVGLRHVRDARALARKYGGNADSWMTVRKYLLKLSKPHWYKQTRSGYARGWEAVAYVADIRGYYDVLVWMTESMPNQSPARELLAKIRETIPPLPADAGRSL